ncbi:MAG: hypothetical protein CVU90_09480 [Firmicutes bacterium HGW-Firmicutes-15]|nr:MAG: hypothetical protein CVU90_09480 [Firmicutes bacterium HGW-Firmicutes-15]
MENFPIFMINSVFETILLVHIGFLLIGVKPKLRDTFVIALIAGVLSYMIRSWSLPIGVTVLIQFPVLIVLTAYFNRLRILYAVLGSLLGLVIIGLTEIAFNWIIVKMSGISIEQAWAQPLWSFIFTVPEFLFLACVVIVLCRYNLALFKIEESNIELGEHYEQY